jgi:hypothetical protein
MTFCCAGTEPEKIRSKNRDIKIVIQLFALIVTPPVIIIIFLRLINWRSIITKIAVDQYNLQIHHIGTRRACQKEAARCLEKMVGIIVF